MPARNQTTRPRMEMRMKSPKITGWRTAGAAALALSAMLMATACSTSDDALGPNSDTATALTAVQPEGGTTGVDPNAEVVLEFSHPVNPTMSDYADVHEGDLQGPEVAGSWSWSEDRTVLTFRSEEPFAPATTYVVHVGGGMTDADGDHVNLGEHGSHMGGDWATGSMMGSGQAGGMMGADGSGHMGEGWEHPSNGSYGMVFRFTTSS